MSTRSAYHKLHWTYAPEYLFGVQISDAGQYFLREHELGLSNASLEISIQGSERAIRDCMSEEDAKSICAACDGMPGRGKVGLLPAAPYPRRTHDAKFDTTINPVRDPESGNIVKLVGSHRAIEERSTVDADKMAKRRAAAKLDLRLLSLQERCSSGLHPICMI